MTGHCNHCGEQVCTDATPSLREAAQMALEALVWEAGSETALYAAQTEKAITALRAALAQHEDESGSIKPASNSEPVAWLDEVKRRLLTWRHSFVNRHGDQLALDDFMDTRSLDDLIDFVCDRASLAQQDDPVSAHETEAYLAGYADGAAGSIKPASDPQSSNPVSSNPTLSSEPVCPRPGNRRPDNFTMAECILAGECGCTVAGHAYASTHGGTQSTRDRYANKLRADVDDTPITPFGSLSTHREWQGLTDEELIRLWNTIQAKDSGLTALTKLCNFARAIEAKLKSRNS